MLGDMLALLLRVLLFSSAGGVGFFPAAVGRGGEEMP